MSEWIKEVKKIDNYRYYLRNVFNNKEGLTLIIIQKNPSFADDKRSDPTEGKVKNWALRNGFVEIIFLNLFSYITSNTKNLKNIDFETLIGKKTDSYIQKFINKIPSATIVAAWGNCPKKFEESLYKERVQQIENLVGKNRLKIVGTITQNKYPRHGLNWNGNPKLDDYSKYF